MNTNRREFLRRAAIAAGAVATPLPRVGCAAETVDNVVDADALDREAARPVLDRSLFATPIIIESIELLEKATSISCASARRTARKASPSITAAPICCIRS